MKDEDWERLLKQSLASGAQPDDKLNESIINQWMERSQANHTYRKRLSAALLSAVLLLVLSVSTYAAVRLLSAEQVAKELGEPLLANAFETKDAMEINQTMASGDYIFTLHGLVSGAGLSDFPNASEELYPDRTYAVVSITRQDGKPMPDTADPDYGKDPFFISPLVKGLKPWIINIASMNGAYSEDVIHGVTYRIIECDQVEIFADRGVYLAISSGTTFYSNEAFNYDESTGEIEVKEDYPGAALLFDLPLDPANADPAKAETYLEELLHPQPSQDSGGNVHFFNAANPEFKRWIDDLRAKIRNGESIGETIVESIKEVEYDDSGNMFTYTYGDQSATVSLENLFEEGQIGFTDRKLSITGDENSYKALLIHKDENGIITGRIVKLDN